MHVIHVFSPKITWGVDPIQSKYRECECESNLNQNIGDVNHASEG